MIKTESLKAAIYTYRTDSFPRYIIIWIWVKLIYQSISNVTKNNRLCYT